MIKQRFSFLKTSGLEILGFVAVVGLFFGVMQFTAPPTGKELYLMEAAREALQHPPFFHPAYNQVPFVPVSPLMTLFMSLVFKLFSPSILMAHLVILVISVLGIFFFYQLVARLFHAEVGTIAAGFALASWGFLSNSQHANGAMLYLLLNCIILTFFFLWFDSVFRSRTYAKSLYSQFMVMGAALGLCFCTFGIPGVIFPLGVMVTTVLISQRPEFFKNIPYSWFGLPFLAIILIWTVIGIVSFGPWPYLVSIFRFQPTLYYLLEPLVYLLPILPLCIPALLNKDLWGRALLMYHKTLSLMAAWVLWGLLGLVFLGGAYHEAFSLLLIVPMLCWVGYYLAEVFRNPLMPKPLQWVLDFWTLSALFLSVCCILITLQLVPPDLAPRFFLLTFILPMMGMVLLVLKDMTISRSMPFYVIPCAIVLCVLVNNTFEPWLKFQPAQALSHLLSTQALQDPSTTILEWTPSQTEPSMARFLAPLKNAVIPVETMAQLESLLQTRKGIVYAILPESQYYQLPPTVRETGFLLGRSWQWLEKPTLWTVGWSLTDETRDFRNLTEPVFLFEMPTVSES